MSEFSIPAGPPAESANLPPANFVVISPSGGRVRVPVAPVPFHIGRHADNQLILRDNRISRVHARIVYQDGRYILEDQNSRHGVWVNGVKVARHVLHSSDRVEFGISESYKLVFTVDGDELQRMIDQVQGSESQSGTGSLSKLRALVEVARALQSSLSIDQVLTAVVDAALAVTGCERGFLMLSADQDLEISVARDRKGRTLSEADLRVPRGLILHALQHRRELLSMNFDPTGQLSEAPTATIADLELRAAICVPLVRMNVGRSDETQANSARTNTVGVIYMDSRSFQADLSAGNRELLQTLALETSTILENARLLDEERKRMKLEDELEIARGMQQELLPPVLPESGWLKAAGSSIASAQVGGDYYDVRQISSGKWAALAADVSGKGVSAALVASLLQGTFLMADGAPGEIERMLHHLNHFLLERTRGEKFATIFHCEIDESGMLTWCNAGHCAPLLVRTDGRVRSLQSTATPVGMVEGAPFQSQTFQLEPGDKIVIYSDGLTDSANPRGEFFDAARLRTLVKDYARLGAAELHKTILAAIESFSEGRPPDDDITCVVLEYGS